MYKYIEILGGNIHMYNPNLGSDTLELRMTKMSADMVR